MLKRMIAAKKTRVIARAGRGMLCRLTSPLVSLRRFILNISRIMGRFILNISEMVSPITQAVKVFQETFLRDKNVNRTSGNPKLRLTSFWLSLRHLHTRIQP